MHVHTVFFWLNEETTQDDRTQFEAELYKLLSISNIKQGYWGTPASTGGRAVVDDSYDYNITVIFDDLSAHDAYQVDPLHEGFVENNKALWAKVQVYDVTTG